MYAPRPPIVGSGVATLTLEKLLATGLTYRRINN